MDGQVKNHICIFINVTLHVYDFVTKCVIEVFIETPFFPPKHELNDLGQIQTLPQSGLWAPCGPDTVNLPLE